MARPSNADRLARYRREVARSTNFRKQKGYDALWKRMRDLYAGKHYQGSSNDDRMVVNIAKSTIDAIAPSVAVNNPRFTVNARSDQGAAQAVIAEDVLNYTWKSHKFQQQFRRAVNDSLIMGPGWIKVGYKFVQEEGPTPVETADSDVEDAMPETDAAAGPASSETNKVTKYDCPFVERVSPHNIFVDPDATHMSDIKWIAQKIRRLVVDVKADKRYSPSVRKEVTASTATLTGEQADEDSAAKGSPEDGYCDIYEYYDVHRGLVCVFADSGEDFLIKPQPMPYTFGHPFVYLPDYEVPDTFYAMGEIEAIEELQRELNETRSQMFNHRKKFAPKWVYNKRRFTEDGVNDLESLESNVMVAAEGDGPLQDAIIPLPAIINPPEFYTMSDVITSDIDRVTGTSDYMRGQMPEVRRTATEANMLQDAQNARAADKLAKIENVLAEIGWKLMSLMQQYLTGEHLLRVAGPEGAMVWITYTRDSIMGEFDFEVEAGSTQPRNEAGRRQQALQMVDAMAPFAGAGVVNMPELARHVLATFGVKNPDMFITQAPPPPAGPGGEALGPDGAPPGPLPPGGPMGPPAGGPPMPMGM